MRLSNCFYYRVNTEDKSIKGSEVKVRPLSPFCLWRQFLEVFC